MAAPGRTCDRDLSQVRLRELLEDEPFRFRFFQAVRLLERLLPGRESVGRFVTPESEVVRFRARQSTSFPASEVHEIDWSTTVPRLTVNFMGLTGSSGVLPLAYTELVMERVRARDTALRDFLDLFNHRLISLFYRAWQKYRFAGEYELGHQDPLTEHLLDLTGIGTPGLRRRQAVPDEALLFYSGLLAQHPRSAMALQQILSDYFDVPAEVVQFVGAWYRLDRNSLTRLDGSHTAAQCLGAGAMVGDEVWEQQAGVCIRLGPLPLRRYLDFLPDGSTYEQLRSIVRFYFNDELDFHLQLVLKREQTPALVLGAEGATAPRLGWLTWVKNAPLTRDPGETVLALRQEQTPCPSI